MNKISLQKALAPLQIGELRYFESLGSTNDEALIWAAQGAPDCSLIIADEQTSGRGRMGRKWFTPPKTALALSLILRPTKAERTYPSRTVGLLAVSLGESLQTRGLTPRIKWPNDVLLNGRKFAGILVESSWNSDVLDTMILGLGVNVLQGAVPPVDNLFFPATSVENELGYPLDRVELLVDILHYLLLWRKRMGTDAFINAWEERLAFRGQQVWVKERSGKSTLGKIVGLESDGGLRLIDEHSKSVTVRFGDVHLRPLT